MKVVFTKTEAEKFIRNAYLQQGFSSADVVIIEDATVEAEAEDKAVAEKPWYPDDGNWIEINKPSSWIPADVGGSDVEVLLSYERTKQRYTKQVKPADEYFWKEVVAYKVVE